LVSTQAVDISTLESDEVRVRKEAVESSDNRRRLASPLEWKCAPRTQRPQSHAIHVTYRMCLADSDAASRRQAGGRTGGLLGRRRVTRLAPKSGATGPHKSTTNEANNSICIREWLGAMWRRGRPRLLLISPTANLHSVNIADRRCTKWQRVLLDSDGAQWCR